MATGGFFSLFSPALLLLLLAVVGGASSGPDAIDIDQIDPNAIQHDEINLDEKNPNEIDLDAINHDEINLDGIQQDAVNRDQIDLDSINPNSIDPDAASPTDADSDATDSDPLVETLLGAIRGMTMTSQYGATIYAFRGIPYAQPPLGQLRFAAPQPVEPWGGTLAATSDSLVCPQPGLQIFMSEDCLKLNVFTRNLTAGARDPVLVYIHGGANVLGSGHSLYEAGPQYLLDHEVVFVAFNYRLGALGFLSTGSPEAPGNYGYLDQVLALQWVHDHIASFGGDPDRVTILGLSAGAMAVTLHLASPLSAGLFQRAIAMSGSATNHFDIDNGYWTRKLARELSCPMYAPEDVLACLREVSWKTIVDVCSGWEPYKFTNMKWNYEIDGNFLLAHPDEVLRSGAFNRVPLIAGTTRNELDFSVFHQENNSGLLHDISVNFDKYAPEIFLYKVDNDHIVDNDDDDASTGRRIQEFYLGEDHTEIGADNLERFGQIFSDAIIGHGVHRLVQLLRGQTKVFYYQMNYVGQRSLYTDAEGRPRGVGHADDLQYVMPGYWYGQQLSPDDPDMFMVDRMTRWWTSFAKDGSPQQEFDGQWEPVEDEGEVAALYISTETQMQPEPFQDRYTFWDDLMFSDRSGAGAPSSNLAVALGIAMASGFLRRLLT